MDNIYDLIIIGGGVMLFLLISLLHQKVNGICDICIVDKSKIKE